jgi:hypothetical protein
VVVVFCQLCLKIYFFINNGFFLQLYFKKKTCLLTHEGISETYHSSNSGYQSFVQPTANLRPVKKIFPIAIDTSIPQRNKITATLVETGY